MDDSSPPPAIVRLKKFYSFVDPLVRALPLITIAGFVATEFALYYIFMLWGLSFIQIADPSDMVFAGFAFALALITGISTILLMKNTVDMVLLLVAEVYRYGALVLALGSSLLAGAFGFCASFMPLSFRAPLVAFAIFVAVGVSARMLRDLVTVVRKRSGPPILALCTVVLAIASAAGAESFLGFVSRSGLASGLWVQKVDGKIPCEGQVLWLGTKSVVVRCGADPTDIKHVVVLASRDGLVLYRNRANLPPYQPAKAQ